MPGLPGVLIGRTTNTSWGITMALTDFVDYYVMEPDPANPTTHYMHNGTSKAYTFRTETIEVYGASPVTIRVKESLYGPDMTAVDETSTKHTICMSGTMFRRDQDSIKAILNFYNPNITTVQQLQNEVFAKVETPGLSISFNDRQGGIGYAVTGWHVKRRTGHTGRLPTYGNGTFDWEPQRIPYTDLPSIIDTNASAPGFTSCANQRIYPHGYQHSLGYDWSPGLRGDYLQRRLPNATAAELGSLKFHQDLQTSVESSLWTMHMRPNLVVGAAYGDSLRPLLSTSGLAMLNKLLAWDGQTGIGSTDATTFWMFIYEISKLPTKVIEFFEYYTWIRTEDFSRTIMFRPTAKHQQWCKEFLAARSLAGTTCLDYTAYVWNKVAEDTAGQTRRWGLDNHFLTLYHLIFHGSILECLFDRKIGVGGDQSSLAVAKASGSKASANFPVFHPASMRKIYDWNTPNQYYFSWPGGSNGSPFSEYYLNLLSDYAAGRYKTVLLETNVQGKTQTLRP